MKRLLALSFIGTSFFIGSSPLKADWDVWALERSTVRNRVLFDLYTLSSDTQEATRRERICESFFLRPSDGCSIYFDVNDMLMSPNLNGVIIKGSSLTNRNDDIYIEYDLSTDTWSQYNESIWIEDYDDYAFREVSILKDDGSRDIYDKGKFQFNIQPDGATRFGSNSSDISINKDGLKSGTNNVLIGKR